MRRRSRWNRRYRRSGTGDYDADVLHGRGPECSAIDVTLRAARESRSGSLAFRGEPGVGTSALLAYAAERADGFQVLRAAGTRSESAMPYAGLQQLVRPALSEHLDALPHVQAAALSGALGLAATGGSDRFLIGLAVLSLLSDLAEAGPVLALVDDLQWIDEESADALRFVARRIDAEGIVLVVSSTEATGFDGSAELTVVGLDRVASDALLIERSGTTPAPDVRAFLWEQTHGNPFALIEMAGSLTAAQLEGAEPLPDDVQVGLALQHTLTERVARLPHDTRTLLLIAAAEGTGDTPIVLRAAGSLGVSAEALEPAELAGLVSVDGLRLAFRDPLMRSAIYHAAPFGRRRAAHLAIADELGDGEADRRTWHRSAATVGPDDEVAEELVGSADRALARGGHATASTALERAADLSSDRALAAVRLAAAAHEAWLAGRGARAAGLADRAAALIQDPVDRAEVDVLRAQVEAGAGDRRAAFEQMLTASATLGEADPTRAADVLVEAGRIAWMEADPVMMIEVGGRMDALGLRDDAPEAFGVGVMQGLHRLLEGDPDGAAKLIGDSIDRADPADPRQLHLAGVASMFMRDDRTARELLARAVSRTRELGNVATLPRILVPVALLETWEGAYPAARSHATEGERLARDVGEDHLVAHFTGVLAWIAAVRGESDASEELAASTMELAHAYRVRPSLAIGVWAMALNELGAGRWADAATRLEAMVPPGAPDNHPTIGVLAAADLIEAAMRAERRDLAQTTLDTFVLFGQRIAAPWTRALAARGRAMLADDVDNAAAAYEEALAHHAESDRRFEEARTRLLYGEHLRRMKRRSDARTQLRGAIDVFERLGAAPWEERARTELRATGETARKRDVSTLTELTPQQAQIVRLVAEGATNKEVAAQLFLSPRTVDYHLRNVFVKLGISSRAELIRLPDLDDVVGSVA
jgi:DNA-binding CsgD family transcriptional regulator